MIDIKCARQCGKTMRYFEAVYEKLEETKKKNIIKRAKKDIVFFTGKILNIKLNKNQKGYLKLFNKRGIK